jgi:ligand-binding sensor domain-containing protein
LFRREDGKWTKFTERDGLSGKFVRTLAEDSEGHIWAGTNANGLDRLRKRSVITVATGVGLPAESVVPILEDRAGAMWMGIPALARAGSIHLTACNRRQSRCSIV